MGSLSETKEPASVVCQLMMILHWDLRRGVILRIKLFVSLVACFPMYGSGIQIFFKLGLLSAITFSLLRLSVVVEAETVVPLGRICMSKLPLLISGLMIMFSSSVIIMLASVGVNGQPIETPSICL